MSNFNGHNITLVGEGELAFCTRCRGGEVELEESCIDRMTTRVKDLTAERYQLRAELAAAKAVVEKLRDALAHIAEYWNRSENDKAMNDALYHMIDTAEAALASGEAGNDKR